jgi:uncharacterized DUF497 family protein
MDDAVIMPDFQGFDWDQANVSKNWQAHHVSPNEAEQVFFNRPLLTTDDPKHSEQEKRYYVLGRTDQGRMLFVAFTVRGVNVRIISARDMSRKERRLYRQV